MAVNTNGLNVRQFQSLFVGIQSRLPRYSELRSFQSSCDLGMRLWIYVRIYPEGYLNDLTSLLSNLLYGVKLVYAVNAEPNTALNTHLYLPIALRVSVEEDFFWLESSNPRHVKLPTAENIRPKPVICNYPHYRQVVVRFDSVEDFRIRKGGLVCPYIFLELRP